MNRERITEVGDMSIDMLCELCRQEINEVINRDYLELNLNREETNKREVQQRKLRRATRNACLGDLGDREYLKEYIKDLLQKKLGINEKSICDIIHFNNPAKMSGQDKFEYMYVLFFRTNPSGVFAQMVKYFGWDMKKNDSDEGFSFSITEEDVSNAFIHCPCKGDYNDRLDTLVQRCYQKLYGHDCADILIMDESVDGISGGVGGRTRVEYNYLRELNPGTGTVNSSKSFETLYCVLHGKLIRLKFLSFGTGENLERVVKNIYRYNSRTTLSQKNPIIQSTFRNGSRVVVARPPVSDGYVFYVRKFMSSDAGRIETLITYNNCERVIGFLKMITKGELNFVISGPMGSGKTTFLKALVGYMNPQYTIRVAESAFELNLNNLYPERNIHVMQERGNFTIYDILNATKKMDTDIMIVGEVNEPKLAGAYVQVAQSGSRMAVTTLHHETTRKLIEYLRNALVSEFGLTDTGIAEKQVADILNFDIHTVKDIEGRFYIERITEIVPEDENPYPRDINSGTLEYYRRRTDRHCYRLRNIIEFNHDSLTYEVVNDISAYTMEKLKRKLDGDSILQGLYGRAGAD